MAQSSLIFLCFVLSSFGGTIQAQPTAVLTPAQGFIASLGSSDTTFNCTVTGTRTVVWIVDGTNEPDLDENRGIMRQPGIIDNPDGSSYSSLLIPSTEVNHNSSIQCIAVNLQGGSNGISEAVQLLIQGLLDTPSGLSIASDGDFMRKLTWQAPDSLDITNIDPDICHYNVCSSISSEVSCTTVQETEYSFLNVRLLLNLSVSAVNVVGESIASTITHQPCDSATAPVPVDSDTVTTSIELQSSGSNPSVTLSFEKNTATNDCFDLYRIQASTSTQGDTLTQGPLIPVVESRTDGQGLTISLNVETGLSNSRIYNVNITTVNVNGENSSTGSIQFSTYDIQAVSVSARAGAIAITCTFVSGSQVTGCDVEICELVGGTLDTPSCQTQRVPRDPNSPISTQLLSNLQPGLYTVQTVSAVHVGGSMTEFSTEDMTFLQLEDVQVTIPPPPPTTPMPTDFTVGPTDPLVTAATNVGVIAGSVIGVFVVILIVVILVVVMFLYISSRSSGSRSSRNKNETVGLTSTEMWLEDTDGGGAKQLTTQSGESPLHNLSPGLTLGAHTNPLTEMSVIQGKNGCHVEIDLTDNSSPDELQINSVELTEKVPMDRKPPPSPPYDSMEPSQPQSRHSNPVAVVHPTISASNTTASSTELDNLSADDVHEVKLTASLDDLAKENIKLKLPALASELKASQSEDSLLSQGSQSQKLYAEIDHRIAKKPSKPMESDLVLYSEIKVDELRPVVPQKKRSKAGLGKTWSRDSGSGSVHSTPSHSHSGSLHSDPRLESYHV